MYILIVSPVLEEDSLEEESRRRRRNCKIYQVGGWRLVIV